MYKSWKNQYTFLWIIVCLQSRYLSPPKKIQPQWLRLMSGGIENHRVVPRHTLAQLDAGLLILEEQQKHCDFKGFVRVSCWFAIVTS